MTELEQVARAIERRNITAHCAERAADVAPLVKTLLRPGDVVSIGGSVTLAQCNVPALLSCGDYRFLDRAAPGLTPEDVEALYRQVFSADCYLASVNAISADGQLVNLDGRGNRVAAITFGPKRVILVAGRNKLAGSLEDAMQRVRDKAGPLNAQRLHRATPCAATGHCADCHSPECICCDWQIIRHQQRKDRLHVILVNEDLGY